MTRTLSWLFNARPKCTYNVRKVEQGFYVVLANKPRKAEVLLTQTEAHMAIWTDMEQYEPTRQNKFTKEEFMQKFQATVKWVEEEGQQ